MPAISEKRSAKAHKILAAALALFEQHGFQAASLEQIASHAGMGKSTLYDYFKNKEELFIAAIQEASNQWLSDAEAVCSKTDEPIERLHSVADIMLGFAEAENNGHQRLFIEILMQTIMVGGVFYKRGELIRDFHQRYIKLVTNILLEGVSSGKLKPEIACHVEKLAINFLVFMDGMKYFALVASDQFDVHAQIHFFMDHLTPLLIQGGNAASNISGGSENDSMEN
jgi:AcrR family transcriptional regulator